MDYRYVLYNVQDHPLMIIRSKYNWKSFMPSLIFEIPGDLDEGLDVGEMMLVTGFIVQYLVSAGGA